MSWEPDLFLGIDSTAGRTPYTWAVLNREGRLVELVGGEMATIVGYAEGCGPALAAVNAPPRPNRGLVRAAMLAGAGHVRGADMRLAEQQLRASGISIPPTAGRREGCAPWTQMGFALHQELEKIGYGDYPGGEEKHQRLETNPHAVFCSLIGRTPLSKPTLEGRLQRQLALHEQGAEISDPMDFFEEITRHKLMRGILPTESVYSAEELDALAAAFTAWSICLRPGEVTVVGDKIEGQIYLPVRELKMEGLSTQ